MPKNTFETYHEDPHQYALTVLGGANRLFDGLRARIRRNMRHYVFESNLTDVRRSKRHYHSGKYFSYLNPACQSLVDTFMQAWKAGDPSIRGKAFYPKDLDPETAKFLDDSANRVEDYANAWVTPDFLQNPEIGFDHQVDQWFMGTCLWPYSVMAITMDHRYEYVNFSRLVDDGFDELNFPKQKREFLKRRVMVMPFPRYELKSPDSCRVDLQSSSREWRYYFEFEDLTADELMSDAELRGYSMKRIREIIDKAPDDGRQEAERLGYGTLSLETASQDVETYRKTTGYFQIFNPTLGYMEIRKVVFVEGAPRDVAMLEESPYNYSYENPPYFVSYNYLLPGERYGQSTSDHGAPFQDMINEFANQSIEAGQKNVNPPMAVSSEAPRNLRWGIPGEIWRTNTGTDGDVRRHYLPLFSPANPFAMDQQVAKAEIGLDRLSQTPDVTQSVSDSPDRRKEPLGRSQMRLAAAGRGIGRMMIRHGNRIAYGFNVGWEMAKVEIQQEIDLGELAHEQVVPEVAQLDLSVDFEARIALSVPSISSFVGRELESAQVMNFAEQLFTLFPQFQLTNPNGAKEVQRRMVESSNLKNADAIVEADEDSPGLEQLAEVA